jgi:PKD repeat protein/sugar lactone lactonase YvrE
MAGFGLPPDLDHSDTVDDRDLIRLSRAWNTTPGDAAWNANADLDFSGLIDANDREILTRHFGLLGRVRRVWILDNATSPLKRLADDGTLLGAFSGLIGSRSLAVNKGDGSVWLFDYTRNELIHLTKNGAPIARIRGFTRSEGLAVDSNRGACWVAETNANRIVRVDAAVPDGYNIATSITRHAAVAGFLQPLAVSVNSADGTCWAADTNHNQIVAIAADGSRELARAGGFNGPAALAADSQSGGCWVADTRNGRVVRLTATGGEVWRKPGLLAPDGICVNDKDGSCLATDSGYGGAVKFDPDGGIVFQLAGLDGPTGSFADTSTGNYWLAERNRGAVVKYSAAGNERLRISGLSYPGWGAIDYGEAGKYAPPTAAASASPEQGLDPLTVRFTCAVADPDGSILRYQWDFDGDGLFDWSSTSDPTTSHTYTNAGIYNPIFRCVDEQGLTALDSSLLIRVGRLTASASASPTSGTSPLQVQFTGTFFDPVDGRVENYQWDFDGDGIFEYFSETQPSLWHTYPDRGTYRAVFKVTDEGGITAQSAVTVEVRPSAPTATARATPSTGNAPLTVRFTGSGQDTDGSVELFQWDFNSDRAFDWFNTINGNTTQVYAARGVYTPFFMVTDNEGFTAATSLTIRVTNVRPTVIPWARPIEGNAPLTVNLSGTAADPDGSIALYEWSFDTNVFFDNMEGGSGNWTAEGTWGLTTQQSHSASTSWTDSPGGNYASNVNAALEMMPLDLSTMSSPTLSFWHRHEFAPASYWSDFGRSQISTDDGRTWQDLEYYRGSQPAWTRRSIDLTRFASAANARLRFWMITDGANAADGWYIDDVRVGADTAGFTWSSPTSATTTHVYSTPGVYTPTLRATDNDGARGQASARIVVRSAGSPLATAQAAPVIGPAPLRVNFNGTGTDPDGQIVRYDWVFERPFENLGPTFRIPLRSNDTLSRLAYNPATGHLIVSSQYGDALPVGFQILDANDGRMAGRLDETGVTFGGGMAHFAIDATPSGRIFHQDYNGGIVYWANILRPNQTVPGTVTTRTSLHWPTRASFWRNCAW